ncbi:MAG: hypothetical protein NZ765_04190 [Anaerolineae bacterium]|nr:hypothetical protein [Anaerolineae bacterium]
MRCLVLPMLMLLIGVMLGLGSAGNVPSSVLTDNAFTEPLQCLAFSPYVAGYDPRFGPHPPPGL